MQKNPKPNPLIPLQAGLPAARVPPRLHAPPVGPGLQQVPHRKLRRRPHAQLLRARRAVRLLR